MLSSLIFILGEQETQSNRIHINDVVKVLTLLQLTDLFGSMPAAY